MLGPCERHGSDSERQWVTARDRASERGKERGWGRERMLRGNVSIWRWNKKNQMGLIWDFECAYVFVCLVTKKMQEKKRKLMF